MLALKQNTLTDSFLGFASEACNILHIKTEKDYKNGLLHGYLKTYYKDGGIYEEVKYEYGKPKFKRAYLEDGTLIDESMFFDKRLIKLITG